VAATDAAVVDASVVLNLLVDPEWAGGPERVLGDGRLSAPAHLDAEVTSAIAGLARGGHASEHRALAAIRLMRKLPVSRVPLHILAERAWSLRHNLNAYEAFYVALALALDCELLTADRGIAAAPGLGIPVKLIAG